MEGFFSAKDVSIAFKKSIELTFGAYLNRAAGEVLTKGIYLDDEGGFVYEYADMAAECSNKPSLLKSLLDLTDSVELIDANHGTFELFTPADESNTNNAKSGLLDVLDSVGSNVLVIFKDRLHQKRHLQIQCAFVLSHKAFNTFKASLDSNFGSLIITYRQLEDVYIVSAPLYHFMVYENS